MTAEVLIVAIVLGIALIWATTFIRQRALRIVAVTIGAVLAVGTCWALNEGISRPLPERAVTTRPIQDPIDEHLGSNSCRSCHPDHHKTWHDSYHRTMTQVVTPTSMRGDFSQAEQVADGRRYVFEKRGDEFWAEFEDPDHKDEDTEPPRIWRQLVMSTGSHHMQVYWYSAGDGRDLGQFPLIYLFEAQRWIPRRHAFLIPYAEKPLSETGIWGTTCINCHATHGRQRLADKDARVSEFGISCEACHGPGEQHVCANQSPIRRYGLHQNSRPDDTIVNPERLAKERSAQVCGYCHAITRPYIRVRNPEEADALMRKWTDEGYPYRPGMDLYKSRFITRIIDYSQLGDLQESEYRDRFEKILRNYYRDEPRTLATVFWPDGMVRVSGREFNGLVESPCYQHGTMTCLSCHQMHQRPDDTRPREEWANDQLKVGADTNQACLQCHDQFTTDEQLVEHTHHPARSTGSLCYNCHMPYTTYGLLKTIRSHTIDSPSVAVEMNSGRMNACNLCHLDKSLGWTGRHLAEWFGQAPEGYSPAQQIVPNSIVALLSGDAAQRAVIACAMGWQPAQEISGTNWMGRLLPVLLDDDYPAVRYIAGRTLRSLPGNEDYPYDFVPQPTKDRSRIKPGVDHWVRQRTAAGESINLLHLFDTSQGGRASESVFLELLKQRDQSTIYLAE